MCVCLVEVGGRAILSRLAHDRLRPDGASFPRDRGAEVANRSTPPVRSARGQEGAVRAGHLHEVHHPGDREGRLGRADAGSRGSSPHQGPRDRSRQARHARARRSSPTTSSTPPSRTSRSRSSRPRTTTTPSAPACSRRSTTPRCWTCRSCSRSNGDGFLLHDRTGRSGRSSSSSRLDEFPSPDELWRRYCAWKGMTPRAEAIVTAGLLLRRQREGAALLPVNAINRTIEAVAKGQNRILL